MIELKADYKDAVLDIAQNEKRKFSSMENADGTISLEDSTVYSQIGDPWGAEDVNKTNGAVIELRNVRTVTLSASGWSSSAPYTQQVNVPGITADDTPIVSMHLSGTPTAANVKAMAKAYAMIDRAVTNNGSMTFYCYNKKPAVDITAAIKGV